MSTQHTQQPLVSIITPCYNGEMYVHRFFDSVLAQTYSNIELIFVNDGSTDRTEEIALEYQKKLEARNIRMTYLYQENGGAAAAINQALPLFKGDYLTWPDSDDWMSPDCIEKKTSYLEAHPEKGFVYCATALVPEDHPDTTIRLIQRTNTACGQLFDDLLWERDIIPYPGAWMVRSAALLSVIPQRQIYPSRMGQNWQLLLPLGYRYECGFLDDVLFYYLLRSDSVSRKNTGFEGMRNASRQYQDIKVHVLRTMDLPEKELQECLRAVEITYARSRLQLAGQFHEGGAAKEEYESLLRENAATGQDRRTYLRGRYRFWDYFYKAVSVPKRAARKLRRIIGMK